MQEKKHFISINEEFQCQHCGFKVPKATKTCRNHCPKCLYSLHVDKEIPGDRASDCHGLMEPIALEIDQKRGYIITHKCTKCGKVQRNKTAEDDDFDTLTKLLTQTNERNALN